MSKPILPRYKTTNWASYNAALKRRGSMTIWFDSEMVWKADPSGKLGGRQVYGDAAIQACLTLKVVFGMALRQTTGFVTSLLKMAGLDWSVTDFSTLSRRQKDLFVVLPRRASIGSMHLLIDSTGIKVEGDGEWHACCTAHTSMVPPSAAAGSSCISLSTRKRWRFWPSRSRVQASVTPPRTLILIVAPHFGGSDRASRNDSWQRGHHRVR